MEYCLVTKNLCKNYRSYKVLRNVNMHIPKGSIYGFVGKNGAGKTTMIRVLCGLQAPSSGTYELYGKLNTDRELAKIRKRMGAVVESPSIYLEMTARENIKMQYRILGLPTDETVDEILDLVGLGNTGKKKVKNFSLGMRQRLGIAISLCSNPDFLILDEPMNGLDPQGIVEIRELILKLNREKKITILISSHILDELSKVATHFGFIDHGELVREVSAKEIEEACRKSLHVVVSDTKALCKVLDERGIYFEVISTKEADILGNITITELVTALNEVDCQVISASLKEENLESYYMNLVGGVVHA